MPATRYARTRDGVSIAYQAFGDGSTPLIIVHPWISHVEIYWEWPGFRKLIGAMAESCRVAHFDKRGVGLSDRLVTIPTFEARLDDVTAVLDAERWDSAALFGYGDGAALAAAYAATYPGRVSALVLQGDGPFQVAATETNPGGYTREQFEADSALQRRVWGDAAEGPAIATLVDDLPSGTLGADPAFGPWMAKMMRYSLGPGDVERIDRIWFETDASAVVDLIQAPTLVYYRSGWEPGDIDEARRHAARIRGAEVTEVDGSGFPPWSAGSEIIGRTAADFVNRVREDEARYDRTLSTVLFTDIVRSTEQLVASGDADWSQKIADHRRRVRAVLARYRGREIDTAGDGFFATFDGPARAVIAALAIVDAMQEVGIEIRAGLHIGEVVIDDSGVSGLAVHVGARVASQAQAGQVLVTRTVVDLVAGSGLAFEEAGEHQLKGVPGTWQLFRAFR